MADLTILVLSEDSGKDGRLTVKRVIERLLLSWHEGRQVLEIDDTSDTPAASLANLWASKAGGKKQVDFIRRLATELGTGRFVVFHYDGDTSWERRADAQLPAKFERMVRTKLAQLRAAKGKPVDVTRLLEMVPHYHIESWVYQATDRAIQISQEQHGSTDVELYQKWAAERALLDEVPKPGPKEMMRLRDKHNAELAQHIPSVEVIAVNKSFAAFARKLYGVVALESLRRPEIVAALQSDGP